MAYINSKNEYPRYIGDLQLEKKNFKEGDDLPAGWFAVLETEPPVASEGKVVEEVHPAKVDGFLSQQFVVRDLTEEELERRNAPSNAKSKLLALGLTEVEVSALVQGLVR